MVAATIDSCGRHHAQLTDDVAPDRSHVPQERHVPGTQPRYLQLEPTTRCNFRCGFCVGRHLKQHDMSWETFETILRAYRGLVHFELQGEGEPLLHPRFFDMVTAAHAIQPGVRVSTITNGSLLEDNIGSLLEAGLHTIFVSIESACPDEFHAIRGGDLETVIRGIRKLMEERRRRGLLFPSVGFAVTVLRRTRKSLPDVIALYEELNMDGGVSFQPLQAPSTYTTHYTDEMRSQILSAMEAQECLSELQRIPSVQRVLSRPTPALTFYQEMWGGLDRPGCPWLEHGLYVDSGGTALPCCFTKDAEHRLGDIGSDLTAIQRKQSEMQRCVRRGSPASTCIECTLAKQLSVDCKSP